MNTNTLMKGLKIGAALVISAAFVETGCAGGQLLCDDVKFTKDILTKPKTMVVTKKKHFWSRPKEVTININTGKEV